MQLNFKPFDTILYTLLLLFFIYFFGYPSVQRYLSKSVRVITSTGSFNKSLPSPAITLCVDVSDSFKIKVNNNGKESVSDQLRKLCDPARTGQEINECFSRIFYDNHEVVQNMTVGNEFRQPNFTSNIILWEFGKCHNIGPGIHIGSFMNESLAFIIDPNLQYRLFIHDPDFFFISANPLTIPAIEKVLRFPVLNSTTLFWHLQFIRDCK